MARAVSPQTRLPIRLPIQERFVSIQGEGILAGTPSTFIRVAGCNLRCTWCDSPATSWHPEGRPTPLDELIAFADEGPRHVVLTGGEPLLFAPIAALSRALSDAGHHVTIETAGTVWLQDLACDLMSISPKLAHSAPTLRDPQWAARHEARRFVPETLRRLMAHPYQLKFVVRARDPTLAAADVEEIEGMLDTLQLQSGDRARVLLMPECIDPARLGADYATLAPLCRATGFRLGPRLHITAFGHTPGT